MQDKFRMAGKEIMRNGLKVSTSLSIEGIVSSCVAKEEAVAFLPDASVVDKISGVAPVSSLNNGSDSSFNFSSLPNVPNGLSTRMERTRFTRVCADIESCSNLPNTFRLNTGSTSKFVVKQVVEVDFDYL
ncbi:hypothetical protein Nepgr_028372 [Nepenthes gracilis]|uniref:Uncharacterized protein n=1 Tax=Nepenthes gracilis TaxID=150966 RepID=A0AAD3TC38_NEPGR|nr:hypothetical protein Nepgr_028372 [Nepenthes gracilis]